jgi:hypothetical protein
MEKAFAGTAAALAVVATLAGPGRAAATAGPAAAPVGRVWDSWAYDPPHHDMVLFGGDMAYRSHGPDTVLGVTWTWNGTTWTKRHPATSPSPRTGAPMVFDGATGQLLLFGGSRFPFTSGGFLGDTWVWTGTTWTRLHPATSPPARHNADLVYDQARHQVILFGGYNGHYLRDTWAWNGTTWTKLHPAASPPRRDTHSMVYDPATHTVVLFGGYNGHRLGGTWSWDGTTRTLQHPASAPGVVSPAWQAAYDRTSHQLLIFGGDHNTGFSSQTWAWAAGTWNELQPTLPPPSRAYGSLAFDQALHTLVLFGGSTGTTDPATIWEWNGTAWQRG